MSMTLGKDVSALFPDVLKNLATGDLDQKKLVYLYLMCVAALWKMFIKNQLMISAGITQSLTPISVSSLSILSCKMRRTPILSFVRLP